MSDSLSGAGPSPAQKSPRSRARFRRVSGRFLRRALLAGMAAFVIGAALAVLAWIGLTRHFLPRAFQGRESPATAIAASAIRWLLAPGFAWNRSGWAGGPIGTLVCAAIAWGGILAGLTWLLLGLFQVFHRSRAATGRRANDTPRKSGPGVQPE